MTETLSALDTLGYYTLELLRGDEELTLDHLVTEGSVKEFVAHTILLNLNRERNVGSLSSSPSCSTFVVDGKPISINESKSSPTAGNIFGTYSQGTELKAVFVKVKNGDRDIEHEFKILMELNRQGCNCFPHAHYLDPKFSYLVLEDFGINLSERMASRILPVRKVIVSQLLDIVAALHQYGVMHGDIKPQNILCHNDSLKLCDFDSARHVGEVFPRRPDGRLKYTCAWVSPEVFLADQERKSVQASLSIDVFSVGLLVEVLCRKTCFASSTALPTLSEDPDCSLIHRLLTDQEALYDRMEGLREIHLHSSLLRKMLELDPSKRETIHNIQESYHRLTSVTAGMIDLQRTEEDLHRERKRNEDIGRKVDNLADKDDLGNLASYLANEINRDPKK
jgi:serine/threonine protein kinase